MAEKAQESKRHETKESLERKQQALNRAYVQLMKEGQGKPIDPARENHLARLREEINVVDKALKAFK
jgi:hypothetical protein